MAIPFISLGYLLASSLFIFALKGLTHPRTAVRGNLFGALGMLLAVALTLLDRRVLSLDVLFAGLLCGGAIGALLAVRIQMTAMPQLVAVLNGLGGGASAFVAGAALIEAQLISSQSFLQLTLASITSGFIGAVTFGGSLVAFTKLQGLVSERAVHFRGQFIVNVLLVFAAFVPAAYLLIEPTHAGTYWLLISLALVLGVFVVLPVGGADMPVVIAFLNSCSGLAAAATGFVLLNNVLIIAGSLVGASGFILTRIMCRAMNRSLSSIFFGLSAPQEKDSSPLDQVYAGRIKTTSPEEVAILLDVARRVVVVPGYGLAVAQAQHAVAELIDLLETRGVEVEFAIHPVAGRMPGHMNVLLAEADIAYEKLKDLDESNPTFEQTDVVLVIGANDVVNPLARTDPSCPIAGMPILDVDRAQTVIVLKRSLSPGFAGIANPLFADTKTQMLFGDGKKTTLALVDALEEL